MHSPIRYLVFALLLAAPYLASAQPLYAGSDWVEAEHLQLRAHAYRTDGGLDAEAYLGIEFVPDPGWHIYWKNPGDTGLPTGIQWQDTTLEVGGILWPAPVRADYQGFINYGYYDRTILLQPVGNPDSLGTATNPLTASVDWLICEDICIPGQASIPLAISSEQPAAADNSVSLALNEIPQQLGLLEGNYNLEQGQLTASFALPAELQGRDVINYFPVSKGLVVNREPPGIESTGTQIQIDQMASGRLPALPAQFEGLVQLQTESGDAAWFEFSLAAAPGLVTGDGGQAGAASTPLLLALFLAFLGGIILNLMPCVLPVLSLKAMQIVENADNDRARRGDALAYTLGITLSFIAIALILLALRATGEQIGWGFQLQNAGFVAFLVCLMFLLGLALSGFIELGASLTRMGNFANGGGQGKTRSFATGLLATLVATPCTAPFMGVAMGAALTMPTLQALTVFVALGLGLAFPMLLVGFIPGVAHRLPRPGQWMVTLKEILAFPLYLTAIWLLWVYSSLAGSDAAALLLVLALTMVFALWLSRRAQTSGSRRTAVSGLLLLLISLIAAPLLPQQQGSSADSQAVGFEPALISAAVANGQPVFVNVTADWCISCKVNERVALKNRQVQEFFEQEDVLYLVADWTRADPAITNFLESFGRSGVPLYLVYLPGQAEPLVLPQILTPSSVVEAFRS